MLKRHSIDQASERGWSQRQDAWVLHAYSSTSNRLLLQFNANRTLRFHCRGIDHGDAFRSDPS